MGEEDFPSSWSSYRIATTVARRMHMSIYAV